MAVGSALAAFVSGPLLNRNYRRYARKLGMPVDRARQQDLTDFPIERARLEVGLPMVALAGASVLCWGWVLEQRVSPAAPCMLMFTFGLGMTGFNNALNVLLIDVTPGHAGAAVAANNLARCLLGAVVSAVILPMINHMGIGWAFVLIGLLYAVFSPFLLLLMRNGIRYRREKREKEQRRQAKAKQGGEGEGEAGAETEAEHASGEEGQHGNATDGPVTEANEPTTATVTARTAQESLAEKSN